jgi:hypothetical protein
MRSFFTNIAIKHLQSKDFIILNRAEIEKDKSLFKIAAQFLSHINRYNKNVIPNSN